MDEHSKKFYRIPKKNKLDNVNDLWYFVRNSKNRWVAGSAH